MPDWLSDPLKLLSVVIAISGLFLSWRKYREDSLRRSEVLNWANEAITALQGLVTICILLTREGFAPECRERLIKIAFDSAILVERGRLFFRNQPSGTIGATKKPAYRGLRPRVLDPLIAAHQIAMRLLADQQVEMIRLQCVAESNLKEFVSLIQAEVGRERTASQVTEQGGKGFNLNVEMRSVPQAKIDRIAELASRNLERYREDLPPE